MRADQLGAGARIAHHAEPSVHEADERTHRPSGLAHEQHVAIADVKLRHARHAQGVVADRPAEKLQRSFRVDRPLDRPFDRERHVGDNRAAGARVDPGRSQRDDAPEEDALGASDQLVEGGRDHRGGRGRPRQAEQRREREQADTPHLASYRS